MKIGIPRALMYHYYYPAWQAFFRELGLTVLLSPVTNKGILDQGVKAAVDDICLPFKVYYGHVLSLRDKVDYLFVPRFISLGKYNFICPKFMGLPDMLRANIEGLPELIDPVIDLRRGIFPWRQVAYKIGRKFSKNIWEIEKAYRRARDSYRHFLQLQREGYETEEAMLLTSRRGKIPVGDREFAAGRESGSDSHKGRAGDKARGIKLGLVGHSYLLNDAYLSMRIVERLRKMEARAFTVEMLAEEVLEKAARRQGKPAFWYFNRQIMGAAYHLFQEKEIDGLVQVTAFGCGPDSLVRELIDIRGKRIGMPILNINLDEHSGEAGILTRLEAFVDLIERRRRKCR